MVQGTGNPHGRQTASGLHTSRLQMLTPTSLQGVVCAIKIAFVPSTDGC